MKKVFFSASVASIPRMLPVYLDIVKTIKNSKGSVVLDWTKDWSKAYDANKLEKLSDREVDELADHNKFFREHAKAIQRCDIMIAEVSEASLGVGYQVFYATSLKKPVLVLYPDKKADINKIKTVVNINSPGVVVKKYNKNNLKYLINNFINERKENFKKFNFIISKEIDEYLSWLKLKEKNKSKSELLRNKIINELILKDEEFLKNQNKKR